MTLPTTPSPPPKPAARPIGRRRLLFAGLLGAVALPLLAACTEPPPPEPDVLEPLLESAEADAALAEAVVAAFPELADRVGPVAADRAAHADALRQEIDRAVTVPPTESSAAPQPEPAEPPADAESALVTLQEAVGQAAAQAAESTSSLSGHRAGLVGSISASCTTLGEVLR
ncbi:hypothetical protein [Actinoalloteichus hymeniacidonis]|uniref:Uncharacterized protein n=1 Tax=Actinoalloteichus hymeniacidonis TaxID=340345 RepID=A0AAC9HNQ0_9PSEU|nr:hypothetical protein [Actinoalloteichus hymeniacidonis]AOS62647.1 hypothetical protein TL08_09160 [Actinoalloteichus hymeniacidonis]MBB5909321.1 hypothetical protein [Actinoalloteichus hymeniacidonis]